MKCGEIVREGVEIEMSLRKLTLKHKEIALNKRMAELAGIPSFEKWKNMHNVGVPTAER